MTGTQRNGNSKGVGQSLAEFALVLPVLLVLLMGIIDFGRVLMTYAQASASVRNALRYGVIIGYAESGSGARPNYTDCDQMEAIAGRVFFATVNDVTVEFLKPDDTVVACNPSDVYLDSKLANGDRLHITLDAEVNLLTPFLPEALPIVIEGQRTLVKNIVLASPDDDAGPTCGDGICDAGEDSSSCPADCPPSGPTCGDSLCEAGEDSVSCPADCPSGGPTCGDGVCDAGEDSASCSLDCTPSSIVDAPLLSHWEGGSYCATNQPDTRYVGLSWTLVNDPDVEGYYIYAIPDGGTYAGQKKLVGVLSGRSTVQCGGSPDACFNAPASGGEPSGIEVWNDLQASMDKDKGVTYEAQAFGGGGALLGPASNSAYVRCAFKVYDLTYVGASCTGSVRGITLTWSPAAGADGYWIYASSGVSAAHVGAIAGGDSTTCTGDATGPTGCFNFDPSKWDKNNGVYNFIVVPYRDPGPVTGLLTEADIVGPGGCGSY